MYNPLFPDISKLKDADIESKIADLTRKYHIAARFGHGSICEQIATALSAYRSELVQRQISSTQKLAKRNDKNFDDLINVN